MRLVAPLVVDYFAYAARLGAPARRAAHRSSSATSPPPCVRVPRHVARLVARLVTLLVVDYSALPRLVVDYSTARSGASARRATRHTARRASRLRLLRLARARRAAHHSSSTTLPHAGSSSTTSSSPRVRVPRHVARLVTRLVVPLVVDDSALRSLIVDYAVHRDCLSRGNTGSTSSTPRVATTSSSGCIVSTIHLG
jgi:hypothetical protein